jgi:hypothetical protein
LDCKKANRVREMSVVEVICTPPSGKSVKLSEYPQAKSRRRDRGSQDRSCIMYGRLRTDFVGVRGLDRNITRHFFDLTGGCGRGKITGVSPQSGRAESMGVGRMSKMV